MTDGKEELRNELVTALRPYIPYERFEDCKFRITMALNSYNVTKEETSLTVYEGDINEKIIMRFLMAKAARGLSKRTLEYYRQTITETLETIGKPYSQITSDDIRFFLAVKVARTGVQKATANNYRRNLSSFYGWLQKEEILLKNPMNKIEAIKVTKKKLKAFEQVDLEKMRFACQNAHETALLEVLISTWARVSEVAHMRIDEIDGNKVLVHGKGDKEREVYLTPKAQIAIAAYLSEREDDNPLLFPKCVSACAMVKKNVSPHDLQYWYRHKEYIGEGTRDISTIRSTIAKIAKRAGVVGAHPHRFRRTGATMALRGGMPLLTVSKLLGHESVATTQIYLDMSDKELERAHEKYVI